MGRDPVSGRFTAVQDVAEGANNMWTIIKLLPYVLFLYVCAKVLGIPERIISLLLELACGKGCQCSCGKSSL